MDGRRHSVDIPISRTLVALRRVRSLRDPSTNSLSKFSPLVETLNWETNTENGVALDFENKHKEGSNVLELKDNRFAGVNEKNGNDKEFYCSSRKSNSKSVLHEGLGYLGNMGSLPISNIHVEGSNLGLPNQDMLCGNKSLSERYCSSYREKGLELACVTPSSDCLEGVGSCNEPMEGSIAEENMNNNASNRRCQYRKQSRSSKPAAGDVLSRVGSPCSSISGPLLGGSSNVLSLYGNEDADLLDSSQCGCGISRCWSRTPRLRESNHLDAEERPLLGGEREARQSEWRRNYNHRNNGITLYSESPRSLSQKFRPKSFIELVGQPVVSRSLLTAISNGRITPFYLFHGPRGTGKTSASRIFAAALNCLSPEIDKPCGLCRECVLFFSGSSKDVKEVDSMKVNKTQRIRAIIRNAENSPLSSRFKVFIVDECHLLQEDTWATFLNHLEDLSRHVVFIMITPDLHKLPRSAVSRSQRYHFQKIKEVDIASRLEKICVEEGFDFDQNALDFIATKSNGSLRDAEMMLEQLSLIGKKITMSLVYELMGVVSDDELLDLLHLAFSSDTPETVKRARDLMRSRIDPLQLISQLANLIMDILAGKSQEETLEVKRQLLGKYTSEADMQQLSHALKVLSETEKQLRMSKNQTTWLTVALLQLSSVGSSVDINESRSCIKTVQPRDGEFCSTSSTSESLKHLVACAYDNNECKMGTEEREQTLASIWRRAAGMCESSSLKNFLHKRGKLLSISLRQGLAVAELGFYHPKYVAKAEKSWKLIAGALQYVLGHNVEIRMNLIISASPKDSAKSKKLLFSLFSCSRGTRHRSQPTTDCGSDPSENSEFTSAKGLTSDRYAEACSSECGSHISRTCCHGKQVIKTIRNRDGNALSIAVTTPQRSFTDNILKNPQSAADYLNCGRNCGCQDLLVLEPEKQPGCFSRMVKLQRSNVSNGAQMNFFKKNVPKNFPVSVPCMASSQTCFCTSDPVVSCCNSDYGNCCRNDDVLGSHGISHHKVNTS